MTSLLASRRRAEEFARLVDGTGRSADPTLRDLHSVAMRLRPSAVEPSAEFRTALRERLVVAAAARTSTDGEGAVAGSGSEDAGSGSRGSAGRSVRPGSATPRRSRIVAVAVAVVLAGGVAGTAAAARDAQPGGMFYPIKIGLERTQVAVASGEESQGREYLTHASTRLTEVVRMAGGAPPLRDSDTERVALARATLDEVSADTRRGTDLLLRAHQTDGGTAPVVAIRAYAADARPRLQQVRPLLPPGLSGAYARASAAVADADRRARAACPTCGTTTTTDPDAPERPTSPRPHPTSGPTTGPTSGPVPATPGPTRATLGPGPVPTNPGPGGPQPTRTADPLPLPLPTLTLPLPPGPGTPNPKPTSPAPTGTPTSPPPPGLPLPIPLPTLPLPLPLPLPH